MQIYSLAILMIKPDTINIIISGMQRPWIIDPFTLNCNKYITIIFPLHVPY